MRASGQTTNPPALLTIGEVCSVLSLGRTKVYELVNRGDLRTVTVGRARRVPVEAVTEFVAKLQADAAEQ